MNTRRLIPILFAGLIACTSPSGPRAPAGEKPVHGGTFRVSLAEDVDSLDPQLAAQTASLALMRLMHRGLMAFPAVVGQQGLTPVPDLAESLPAITADALTYTFHLRKGIAFSTRALVAADVRAGIERIFTSGSSYRGYFRIIAGADAFAAGRTHALSGVTTPDDGTIVLSLSHPINDMLWILALPAASAVPADLPRNAKALDLPSSGPYRLDRYVPEHEIRFSRNPAWKHGADPIRPAYADAINVTIQADAAAVRSSIERGASDLSLDTPPDIASIRGDTGLLSRTLVAPSGCLRYLWMNTRILSLASRRAVAKAIDRSAVLGAAGGVLAGVDALSTLVRTVSGSPDAPLVPVPATSLTRPTPSASSSPTASPPATRTRFSTTLVAGDRPEDRAEAAAVAHSLAAAGIKAKLKMIPIASLYPDAYEDPAARVPMGIATWCSDWPGLAGRGMLAPLVSGEADYSGLRDKAVEAGLAAAEASAAADTVDAWRNAAAIVARSAVVVPLIDLNELSLTSAQLHLVATGSLPRGDLTASWLEARPSPSPTAS